MGETLHTILTWFFHHPSGRNLGALIDAYWDIVKVDNSLTESQLVELFMLAAEISTLNLEEGIFYIADFNELFERSDLVVERSSLIEAINKEMEAKRNNNGI